MDILINQYVSRYVVPFHYKSQHYFDLYEQLKNNSFINSEARLPKDGTWIEKGFWENYKSDSKKISESELFSFIFTNLQSDSATRSNIGSSFIYKTGGTLFNAEYEASDVSIPFDCADLGIVLFKTGVGFIWYDIRIKKATSIESYTDFQNEFKELARPNNSAFIQQTGYDKDNKVRKYSPFCMGLWLLKTFPFSETQISFWSDKRVVSSEKTTFIPDKALLFQYVFCNGLSREQIIRTLFVLANGYNQKYNPSESIFSSAYLPFSNEGFLISKAGMACVTTDTDSNADFFQNQFKQKYMTDYFFIYILLLYQSYSSENYCRYLTELPAQTETFLTDPDGLVDLEDLNARINLFLIKGIFNSVSNVPHQNDLYKYGQKQLSVRNEIDALTIGLNSLYNIIKEKQSLIEQKEKQSDEEKSKIREESLNRSLAIFGLITAISAALDALNLIDWFCSPATVFRPGHAILLTVISLLTVFILIILFKNRRK